jgi:cyclophilin family peptidyl-prolyl cis-trans isomerase
MGFIKTLSKQPTAKVDEEYTLTAIGKINDPAFQQVSNAVSYLTEAQSKIASGVLEPYMETQFEQRIKEVVTKHGDAFKQQSLTNPMIYAESTSGAILYFKTPNVFFDWAYKLFGYEDPTNMMFYRRRATKAVFQHMLSTGRKYCSIGFSVGRAPVERVTIELFSDYVPTTVDSFIQLLKHPPFCGSMVHRVVNGGWVQMGDWQTGSGGKSSTVSGVPLKDEAFDVKHDRPGLLSMAKCGSDTAGSQFFITAKPLPFFDGQYTVFGRVVGGMRVIHQMSRVKTENERPIPQESIRIVEVLADVCSKDTPIVAEILAETAQAEKEAEEEAAAAMKVQSLYRQKTAKATVAQKRKDKQDKEEADAAVKVQSVYRGKASRASVMKLQHEKEEQAAALKVQSMQRGKMARKRVNGIKQQGQVEIKTVDDI